MLLWIFWLLGFAVRFIETIRTQDHWLSGDQNLNVQTQTGMVRGFINSTTPNVRQFLNVPYALPPINDQRWLPPVALPANMSRLIDATNLPPSCPQYAAKTPSAYTQVIPQFVAIRTAEEQYQKTSEDCLSLAIWTPTNIDENARLPVIMFMTGGAFVTGGIDIDYQLPHHWVQRTQSHIVVTINYRLNIFGFPNARGLVSQNLGILDQRAALEWVRDNIQAFGGDLSRITLWGQSAGGASVDHHNFAFPKDPIAAGLFMDSGSVLLDILYSPDTTRSNFTYVATKLGCGGLSAEAELSCMRSIDFQTIENFIGSYTDNRALFNKSMPQLTFIPIADETVVFSNYTERYKLGALSHLPAIFTTGANEGETLGSFSATAAPNQTLASLLTLAYLTCPAAASVRLRAAQARRTYRWQFATNFTNISPLPWMGAYHSSDLPLLFGTHQDFRGQSTAFEFDVSHAMQDHVLAFMKDPIHGPASIGWSPATSEDILRFGADGDVVQLMGQEELDGPCKALHPA